MHIIPSVSCWILLASIMVVYRLAAPSMIHLQQQPAPSTLRSTTLQQEVFRHLLMNCVGLSKQCLVRQSLPCPAMCPNRQDTCCSGVAVAGWILHHLQQAFLTGAGALLQGRSAHHKAEFTLVWCMAATVQYTSS